YTLWDVHTAKLTTLTRLQLLTEAQHAFLQSLWRTASVMGDGRSIGPFHPVQSSPAGAPNPTMHRGQAHAEAPSHLAQRTSATDGTDPPEVDKRGDTLEALGLSLDPIRRQL